MAKPERHPWPYGPQWNYYPPMLNFSKIPFPNGPQVNVDSNENYLSIRCPEPRRPYHVPYSSFASYCHQENHPVRSYMHNNSVYAPKQLVYRPFCQENINSSYKVPENLPTYPACANYSLTKDQGTCYQTTWNNTSHFQRNPPELDVRHFLATWQDKDDDFVDPSTDNQQTQMFQGNDSIPLDCSKRNSNDKNIRKTYNNDNFLNGQTLNSTGYIVQPYYLKDSISLNRPIVSEELNNNVHHRNNLNYESSHQSYPKHFYPNTVKFPTSKLLSCEHTVSYNQPLNHCDITSNQLRSNLNQSRQKDILIDSSERSQYNLTSSLESGELFCDINPRNEEIQKAPIIHPIFNDSLHKLNNADEQCYFGNENNEFSENLMLSDFHSLKDSWDVFSNNLKAKDSIKVSNNSKSINKVSPQNLYEPLLPNNISNNTSNNSNSINVNNNTSSVSYEGAFNILPNLSVNSLNSIQLNGSVSQSHESVKPTVMSHSVISTIPSKLPSNVPKSVQANTKIRPFQFNEEISSDDIDISIASSGEFMAEEDQPNPCCASVISFSKMKKEKLNNVLQKNLKNNDTSKNDVIYSGSVFNDSKKNCSIPKELINGKNQLNDFPDKDNKVIESEDKASESESNIHSLKGDAIDLSLLKPKNSAETSKIEKDSMCNVDMPNNYFETSNFVQKISPELGDLSKMENSVLKSSSENCENSNKKEQTSDVIMNISKKVNNGNFIQESNSDIIMNNSEKVNNDNFIQESNSDIIMNNSEKVNNENFIQDCNYPMFEDPMTPIVNPDKLLENNGTLIPNDNLLLLAHCSQEYGCQIRTEPESIQDCSLTERHKTCSDNQTKGVRDSVIKCSLRWDRIFNIMSNEDNLQPDMSLDLGPAKVELRMPSDNCSSNHWKIVEADNKIPTSSIVQVKRLILKRKNQCEERIPKMIIKKTEGQEYRSYLKKESSNQAVLHCEKLKIYCDKLSRSPKNNQIPET